MKNILLLFGLLLCLSLDAQILEIPTLKSKGINAAATKVEVSQFDYVNDKGLTLAQSDIETYDEKGRLVKIVRKVHSTGLSYKYTYKLSKKGVLQEEKIVNAANNETIRTTTYAYKKGLLATTTQVQGTVTFVKNYSFNKNGHLMGMDGIENGTSKGEEIYQVDEEGRRTRSSQKTPSDEVAKIISNFTYATEGNLETKTEIRSVNDVNYKIVSIKDLETQRNLKETTINISNSQSSYNQSLFDEDEKGGWVKGEIVDNQFGRSRLVLRQISYIDGTVTGRTVMSLNDARTRYFRQNDQFQVVYNGQIMQTGTAEDLSESNDRLVYSSVKSAMILLKGYDDKAYQTTWHEAEIISHGKDAVVWLGKTSGVDVFMKGKKLSSGSNSGASHHSQTIGNSAVVFVANTLKKSFVARNFDSEENKGKLHIPELTEEHNYWGKASDTTYMLAGYGKYISIKAQANDNEGNKLIKVIVDRAYWYSLKGFQDNFDNGKPGDIFPATYLTNPLEEIKEKGLFNADFSNLKHDNLKDDKYRLKTADGLILSNLTEPTFKKDNELIAYFALTQQYLKMDGYYNAPEDEDVLNQSVSVLLEDSPDAYLLYNEKKSIDFYARGKQIRGFKFSSHLLSEGTRQYGAVVYDSTSTMNYGMSYDLNGTNAMGSMARLPFNRAKVYLLKLEGGSWVIFQAGLKISKYDYTAVEDGVAYYFFKGDTDGEVVAYQFEGYKAALPGEFVSAKFLSGKKTFELSEKLGVNPLKPIEKVEVPKGKPNTFKRDSTSYYLWDASGELVVNYLEWFGTLGTQDAYTQDTTKRVTYKLLSYLKDDFIEGQAIPVAGPDDDMVIKWGEKSVVFLLSGRLKNNVKRVYVKNSPDASEWSELVYDPSNQQTYFMRYPTANGFYMGKGELLPAGKEGIVLTKLNDGKFSIVRQGQLDRNETFKSDIYEGDLIYWLEGQESTFKAYRFKGFEKGLPYDLFYPEVLTADQLAEIKSK